MQRKLHAGRHGQKGGEGSMNTQSHMSLISTRSFHLIYLTGPRENDVRSTNSLNSIRWFPPCLPLPLPQPDTHCTPFITSCCDVDSFPCPAVLYNLENFCPLSKDWERMYVQIFLCCSALYTACCARIVSTPLSPSIHYKLRVLSFLERWRVHVKTIV